MSTYLGAALRGPLAAILPHHEGLTEFRRDLHANPELGFEEHRTAALVAERLKGFGVEVHTGIGRTGVVGVIHGRSERSGRSIGLRADMDALPMAEENEFAHRSTRAELMHGCGHDGHVTILLGAARYLAETRNFDGTAYVIFQPGEEGYAGAEAMIDDGLFRRFPADEVYALHNWPGLPAGTGRSRSSRISVAPYSSNRCFPSCRSHSPANRTRSAGSQIIRSPAEWPAPGWVTTMVRPPRRSVSASVTGRSGMPPGECLHSSRIAT